MTTTLRALFFGAVVAIATTVTLDTVTAAEVAAPSVTRLDGVEVIAHRHNFDADGNLVVTRLDAVVVTGHRGAVE